MDMNKAEQARRILVVRDNYLIEVRRLSECIGQPVYRGSPTGAYEITQEELQSIIDSHNSKIAELEKELEEL